MFDTGSFIGGMIIGGVFMAILTLALTTAYWLLNGKEAKQSDKTEKEIQVKRATQSNGGIRYGDGLDVDCWL